MTTVQEVYDRAVRGLPEHEQVRLASFILWNCGHGGRIDYSTEWSEEDLAHFCLTHHGEEWKW